MDSQRQVFYTRFGDGEVYTMFGKNCLEHQYNEKLGIGIRESFQIDHPRFLKAVGLNYQVEPGMVHGLFAPFIDNDELALQLEKNFAIPAGTLYESHVMFHYLAVFKPDVLNDFLNRYVRPRRKLFIGSTPREYAEKLYGPIQYYVSIPARDAYSRWDEWWPMVTSAVAKVDVVIPSAGVTSNVINLRLWEMGAEVHSLDIGSLVDAAMGKSSRKWIRLMGHRVNKVLLPEAQDHSLQFWLHAWWKEIRFKLRLLWRGRNYKITSGIPQE